MPEGKRMGGESFAFCVFLSLRTSLHQAWGGGGSIRHASDRLEGWKGVGRWFEILKMTRRSGDLRVTSETPTEGERVGETGNEA